MSHACFLRSDRCFSRDAFCRSSASICKHRIVTDRAQKYRICRNKRPGRLIFQSNKTNSKPFWFYVLSPLKHPSSKAIGFVYSPFENHPSKPIGFMCSPLWSIPPQKTIGFMYSPFEKSPIKNHGFCVLPPPPLKNRCLWWALELHRKSSKKNQNKTALVIKK